MAQVTAPPHGGEPDPLDKTGLCLLSFDGGGVRGLSSLFILQGLMKRLNTSRKKDKLPQVKPCEVFDLIGGTSTGGLIAIMLGRLEMDVDECIAAYTQLMATVFSEKSSGLPISWSGKMKARFDSGKLASAVTEVIMRRGLSTKAKLNDGEERGCKVFVCATAAETKGTTRLRSYDSSSGFDIPATILEAALATSAASSYFDPVKIGSRTFVDGGLGANNPVEQVEEEASDIWCEKSAGLQPLVKCFISIGTGNPGKKALEDNIMKFLSKSLAEIATDTTATAERFESRWRGPLENHRYFRYNVGQGLQEVDLAEYRMTGPIQAATFEYMEEQRQRSSVSKCVENLRQKENPTNTEFAKTILEYTYRSIVRLALPSREEKKELVFWLSDLSFDQKLRSTFEKRCPGTGEWLLHSDEYKGWQDGLNDGSSVLWCPGIPGAGKSVMTSLVINHLRQTFTNKVSISYIFCDHNDQENQTTARLISNLLSQVVFQSDEIPPKLVTAYADHLKRDRFPPSIDDSIQFLLSASQSFERSFILVDALDEHIGDDEEEYGFKMKLIEELLRLKAKGRFTGGYSLFFTSRENMSIQEQLYGCRRIEIRAKEEDIKSYLESVVSRNKLLDSQVKKDPAFGDAVMNTIVGNSQGMFLLPSLQMKRLVAQTNIRNVKRELQMLPKTLDDTYRDAMMRIKSQDESHCQLAMRSLLWVLHAIRPLGLKEIRHALASEETDTDIDEEGLDDPSNLLSFSAGLLTLDANSSFLSLAHLSVSDYLKRTRDQWFTNCDRQITETCLVYLSFNSFAKGPASNDGELDLRRRRYPLLDYAARSWGIHAKRSPEAAVKTPILKFLAHDAKVSNAVQAMQIKSWRGQDGFTQRRDFTAMILAAYFGMRETVEILCAKQDEIGATDDAGRTALHYAAENGYQDVVEFLVDHGASVFLQDHEGSTALYLASASGHASVVEYLLKTGATQAEGPQGAQTLVSTKSGPQERTALFDAASRGQIEVVKLLLDAGADVNARTNNRYTALICAAYNLQEPTVRLLVDRGADIHLRDDTGATALHNEPLWGPLTMISFMLEHGADMDAKDNSGRTPLTTVQQCELPEVEKLFLDFKKRSGSVK